MSGSDVVLEEDVFVGEGGHAAKHNAVNDQVNWLTAALADPKANAALLAAFGGAVHGTRSKNLPMFLGTIRNPGSAWELIADSVHNPDGIQSIVTSSIDIRVNHVIGGVKVGTVIAVADESLTKQGFQIGASVDKDYTLLSLYQTGNEASDYVFYDGVSAFTSTAGVFTTAWQPAGTTGVLRLTHPSLGTLNGVHAAVTGRSGGTVPNIGATCSATAIDVEFRDWAGTLLTALSTAMKAFVRHGRSARVLVDPTTVNTTLYSNSNIWLFGVMEG